MGLYPMNSKNLFNLSDLKSVPVRIVIRPDEAGMESLHSYLDQAPSDKERALVLRMLLAHPASVDPVLLEKIVKTPENNNVDKSIFVRLTISSRDVSLIDTLKEIQNLSEMQRRIHIKRKLLHLISSKNAPQIMPVVPAPAPSSSGNPISVSATILVSNQNNSEVTPIEKPAVDFVKNENHHQNETQRRIKNMTKGMKF